jgi:hypothetical protein
MIDPILGQLPLWLVGLLLFAVLNLACAAGFHAHRLLQRPMRRSGVSSNSSNSGDSSDEGYILSAVLGLLALLIGFTFSMALDRYDARRVLVVQEANALGSSQLVVKLLDEPARSELEALLRSYIELRIAYHSQIMSGTEAQQALRAGNAAQQALWRRVTEYVQTHTTTQTARALVDNLTQSFDLASARRAEADAHIPSRVLQMLLLYTIISAALLGYVLAGGGNRHRVAAALFFAALSLAVVLILDLDRPRQGAIQVSQQPMLELAPGGS